MRVSSTAKGVGIVTVGSAPSAPWTVIPSMVFDTGIGSAVGVGVGVAAAVSLGLAEGVGV